MPKSPCRKHNYYPDVRVPQRWQEPALALTFSPTLVSGAAAGVIPPGPSSLAAPPEMPTMGPVQQQGRPGRREEGAAFRTQQNPGLSKGSTRRPQALTSAPGRPLLPGGPGFPQSPWRRDGSWGSPDRHLALPPQRTPHQRGPATCQWPPDALKLADGKALTQSARHQWTQKAWMLEWRLSQGSGSLSTPARLIHLPGVKP